MDHTNISDLCIVISDSHIYVEYSRDKIDRISNISSII